MNVTHPDVENKSVGLCRSCQSPRLDTLFRLGNHKVNAFPEPGHGPLPTCPIELVYCNRCFLIQQHWSAPQDLLYTRHYHYRSGVTSTMTAALQDVIRAALEQVRLEPNDVVLDIGSNDGTLLRQYDSVLPEYLHGKIVKVGVEPATNLAEEGARGVDVFVSDFWGYQSYEEAWKNPRTPAPFFPFGCGAPPAKIITACGMLYDLEHPNQFIADVKRVLHPEGVFIAQLTCLKQMIDKNDVGNLCVKPDALLLGDNTPISSAEVGMKTYGRRGKLSSIKRTYKRRYSGDMVSIKPMHLEPITCTPEHPVLIARMTYPSACASYYRGTGVRHKKGGKRKHESLRTSNISASHPVRDRRAAHTLCWVDAKDVVRGDFVVVPRIKARKQPEAIDLRRYNSTSEHNRFILEEIPLNEDFAWLMGLYVAEGSRGGNWDRQPTLAISLHIKETDLRDRVIRTMASIGYKCKAYTGRDKHNSMTVFITCAPVARAFEEWFSRGAINKKIPDFIMEAEDHLRIAFLRGLVAGDGYQRANKIHLHTSSKTLAVQVQLLLASLGAMVSIGYVKPYRRVIRGRPVQSKDSWQLRGSSPRLAEIFGYEHTGRVVQHGFVGEDYLLFPVKRVSKELYSGQVCNVETEDHTYLVSNAVVHNCHEHLEFYSFIAFWRLLKRNGLRVYDIEENDVNNGSYRFFICHDESERKYAPRLLKATEIEDLAYLDRPQATLLWWSKMDDIRNQLRKFIREQVATEKSVWIYGASTKGNTILQWLDSPSEYFGGAAERSPEKVGRRMVTGVPIFAEETFRNIDPDYALVLPYTFLPEMIEREHEWLAGGGRFLVPLPTPRLIGLNSVGQVVENPL